MSAIILLEASFLLSSGSGTRYRMPERDSMHPQLQELQDAITSATRAMSTEEWTFRREGKWSAAEVLEHLYLSYAGTTRGCERCLREDKTLARTPTLQDWMKTTLVTGLGHFPKGRKSPERVLPKGMPPQDVVSAFTHALAAMDAAITQCETRFGKRKLMDHPILGPLTAQQWRKFHSVHGHHHLKQIQRLRRDVRSSVSS
jgi:Protein of unknown function (DUF1569)